MNVAVAAMGVRNDAAAAASLGAQKNRPAEVETDDRTTDMAVNDNCHLSLTELQQMAAFQQQQIQAQQSLLMAKVRMEKYPCVA